MTGKWCWWSSSPLRRRNGSTGVPAAKLNYRLYHDRGLEVVGVDTDEDAGALQAALKKEPLPWVTLHEKDVKCGTTPDRILRSNRGPGRLADRPRGQRRFASGPRF